MAKSIQQISAETLRIENILSSSTPGEYFSYSQLEELTGIKMDNKGKTYLRTALKRCKILKETIRGKGVKTLCIDNAAPIVIESVQKVGRGIKRAKKITDSVIKSNIYPSLPEVEQKSMNLIAAGLGTTLAFTAQWKKIFEIERPIIGQISN